MSIRKATASHQLHNGQWKDQCHRVDVSGLSNILEFKEGVDRLGHVVPVAVCEGQVTLGQLVKASMDLGFVPQVVPEYPDFTIAGLINGDGIQSSAFRYGVFTHSVVEMEVVLGNGEVRVATRDNADAELFMFMFESYGTLGIVTRATVALRPCLPFVRSHFSVFPTLDEFIPAFDEAVRRQTGDFLEGVAFGKHCYIIIHSSFCSTTENLPVFDPAPLDLEKGEMYYYQYVRRVVLGGDKQNFKQGARGERVLREYDVSPTASFLFRSSRGLYWMLESYVNMEPLMNLAWFRRMCDKKVRETMKVRGFEASGYLSPEQSQRCLVEQDMGIMLKRLREGLEWVEDRLGVYPLWICPVSSARSLKQLPAYLAVLPDAAKCGGDDYLVDIGVYGEPTVQPYMHRRVVKALQEFVDAPSMWGVTYKNKEMLVAQWQPLRDKYHATEAFVGIERKVTFRGDESESTLNEGPVPAWRMVDQYGPLWWIKLPAIVVAAAIGGGLAVSGLISRAWKLLL